MLTSRAKTFFFGVLVLVVCQLHLLRNLTSAYTLAYALAFVIAFTILLLQWHSLGGRLHKFIMLSTAILLFPIFTSIVGLVKGEYSSGVDVFVGWSRLVFVLPIYWIIFVMVRQSEGRRRVGRLIAWISLFAALSIPLQFIVGPISWFAESSMRSGLPRFASLFGSLTALGVVNGASILIAYFSFRSRFLAFLIVGGIIVGSILSLQKAAILNAFIAVFLVLLLRRPTLKEAVIGLGALLLVISAGVVFFGEQLHAYLGSVRITESSQAVKSDDVSIAESLHERLVLLPKISIDYHGADALVYGVGPVGGAGAFGYPDVPMAHNGIVDIFLIGGLGYFLLIVWSLLIIFPGAGRIFSGRVEHVWLRVGYFCIFIVLVNIPFSGLLIFSPSAAMFYAYGLALIADAGVNNV